MKVTDRDEFGTNVFKEWGLLLFFYAHTDAKEIVWKMCKLYGKLIQFA